MGLSSSCLALSQLPFGNDVSLDLDLFVDDVDGTTASQLPFGNDVSLDEPPESGRVALVARQSLNCLSAMMSLWT